MDVDFQAEVFLQALHVLRPSAGRLREDARRVVSSHQFRGSAASGGRAESTAVVQENVRAAAE